MQSWIFPAGVTSILSGNYLTTAGRSVKEDMQMLKDMGLEAIGPDVHRDFASLNSSTAQQRLAISNKQLALRI
jgi:biotin synthase-like enzyme